MALDLDAITGEMIADHLMGGSAPMVGVNITHEELKGKNLNQCPQGVCGIIKWIEAQTDLTCYIAMGFGGDGSRWHLKLKDPETLEVVREWGNDYIRRSNTVAQRDSGFANKHERLGHMVLIKLARKIAEQLGLD